MNKLKFSICNALFLLLSCTVNAKTVIWDIGGILFKPDTMGIFRDVIGVTNPAAYYLTSFSQLTVPVSLRQQAYDILYSLQGYQECNEEDIVRDSHGKELPAIMSDWLKGTQEYHTILADTHAYLNTLEANGEFASPAHRKTIESIFTVMFDPEVLSHYMKPIKEGYLLLQASIEAGHKNIILSNFDRYSFDMLYKSEAGQTVFANIPREDCVVSGECGMVKPHANIFEYMLEKYNLDVADCIFIDDQIENIEAARKLGITAIHVPNQNFDEVLKKLVEARTATA